MPAAEERRQAVLEASGTPVAKRYAQAFMEVRQ
jgi:hypothetical protein